MEKKNYQHPEFKVVEIDGETILAGSDPQSKSLDVSNAWNNSTEDEW